MRPGPPQLSQTDLPCYLTALGLVLAPLTPVWVEPPPCMDEEFRGLVQPGEVRVLPVGTPFTTELLAPVTHPMETDLPGQWIDTDPPHAGRVFLRPSYAHTAVRLFAGGHADIDLDGDHGTDGDIEFFFWCLAHDCPSADWDGDGDSGTDADIRAFFRSLGGG